MKFLKVAAVCAVVSLGVGATTATAGSLITSAKIKNGTIQTVDLSAKAKRALKGNTGAQGVPGINGVQGPAGGFDPAKITYVEGPTVTVGADDVGSGDAICPTGAKALSGGWVVISGDVGEVFGSRSYDSGGSWSVLVYNHSQFTNATITPFAVCAAK